MQVSVIIVNFNTKQLTINCIQSIVHFTDGLDYEIIVVDNASTDASVDALNLLNLSQLKIIESNENLGFGGANNIGVQLAQGEFLFFLNSDTLLFQNSLKELYQFFIANEQPLKMGALGCVLVNEHLEYNGAGSSFPTSKYEAANLLAILPLVGKYVARKSNRPLPLHKPYFEIDYVIGADLMMRKSMFEALNGFDSEFFMYYEESDLQRRMNNELNFKSYILTQTQIIHLEDGSGKQIMKYSNRKRIIVHSSRIKYLLKHDAANINIYKIVEKIYILLSKLNGKYSKQEHIQFKKAVSKVYKQQQ